MNFKTGVMAATLALSSLGSHAQTITRTTTRTVTKSKAVTEAVKTTVRHNGGNTLSFTKAKGIAGDSLKAGKLDSLDSLIVKLSDPALESAGKNKKIDVNYGINYYVSELVSGPTGGFGLDVSKKNASIMLNGIYGRKPGHSVGLIRGHVGYDYPLGKDFSIGGKVGVNGQVHRINGDNGGAIAPEAAVVGKFQHKFDNGLKLKGNGSVGGAINFKEDQAVYSHGRSTVVGDGNLGLDYKKVGITVGGGKDVHMGKFLKAGMNFKF